MSSFFFSFHRSSYFTTNCSVCETQSVSRVSKVDNFLDFYLLKTDVNEIEVIQKHHNIVGLLSLSE